MAVLRDLVRNVALIVLIASFIDLLLPGKQMDRYVKLIVGLFIIVSVLNPVMQFLDKGQSFEVTAWQYQPRQQSSLDSIFREGKELADVGRKEAQQEYMRRLERQIVSLVKLVPGVTEVEASVALKDNADGMGALEQVIILARRAEARRDGNSETEPLVDPVRVGLDSGEAGQREKEQLTAEPDIAPLKEVEQQIQEVICNFYDLAVDRVMVTVVAERVQESVGGESSGREVDGEVGQ